MNHPSPDHYRFRSYAAALPPHSADATVTVYPDREPEAMIEPEDYIGPFIEIEGKTITELYESLEKYIADMYPGEIAYTQYDEKYHYPKSFRMGANTIGPVAPGARGWRFEITEFEDLRGQ